MTLKNLLCVLCAAFLSLLFNSCASANAAAPTSSSSPSSRIIAVGDIHGDFDAYKSILTEAGLIDDELKWVGGKTVFVQTGDIADRGPDTRRIIEHLRAIQKQAKKKGGKVVTLIGNHEAMNMTRDLRYVDPGEYKAFETKDSAKLRDRLYTANQKAIEAFYLAKDPALTPEMIRKNWDMTSPLGKIEHQVAWGPKGKIGKWVTKNAAVALIDDNLFAHGGVSQKYSILSLKALNKQVQTALKAQDETPESIINDPLGPLWYRGYIPGRQASENSDPLSLTPEQELTTVLSTYNARRLIIGHTPEKNGIKSSYGGRLIQIDTGASKYYGGTRSFLRIENGRVFAHNNGTVKQLE